MNTIEINSWSDTLIEFLKSSNEDERVCTLFENKVLPHIAEIFKNSTLNWIEIGAGDGKKTQIVAKMISNLYQYKKIKLTVCEPSIEWLISLMGSNFSKQLPHEVQLNYINKSIEQFVNSNQDNYDFISLVQVMYSSNIKNALLEYVDKKQKGTPCLIWVDVEDKSGDFYQMRQLLQKNYKKIVHSCADELIEDLTDRKISFKLFETTNKICHINQQEILTNNNHWLFPFVLGCNIEDFSRMDKQEKVLVRETIRNYIFKLNKDELNIPDVSILIFIE